MSRCSLRFFGTLLVLLSAMNARAADRSSDDAPPPLPTAPEQWVNTGPISLSALKGKGVVLYFYEESCPTCREHWKEVLGEASKFEGKPVIFIAINSGEPRGDVQSYAREVRIPWPIIVDADRSLEKAYKIGQISLNNIYQTRIVTADGQIKTAPSDMSKAGEQALSGASWIVDPATVPEALKSAWFAVEFGDANLAATAIKGALRSPKADMKQAAEALKKVVDDRMSARLAEAKQALDEGRKWDAYAAYLSVADEFKSYEMPADAQAARKSLAADSAIKSALVSKKSLDAARKLASSDKPAARKQAIVMLEKVRADVPDSSLAREAQALIEQIGTP